MDEQKHNGIIQNTRFSRHSTIGVEGIQDDELADIISRDEITAVRQEIRNVFNRRDEKTHGFETDLGVINSPYDTSLRQDIAETIGAIKSRVPVMTDVVLAGIGGSELGATALFESCGDASIRYHPLTSLNSDNIQRVMRTINPEGTVLIQVSRSGTTKETLTSYAVMKNYLSEKLGDAHMMHCVAILGKDKADYAKEIAFHTKVSIEPAMSGRYTTFHAANLLTMGLLGVDIDKYLSGARYMVESCVNAESLDANPALEIAALKYAMNAVQGKTIWHTGVFSPKLVKYGDWLDQLTEESLGHRDDIRISTKTTELSNKLHSDFQNWVSGPNIFYHQFVFPLKTNETPLANPLVDGEKLSDIEISAYFGTTQALAERGRPSFTTFMASVNPIAMGQLMMRDMLSTIYLGELYGLGKEPGIEGKGYFNQPGVQAYKAIMKTMLASPSLVRQNLNEILGAQR